MKNGKSFNIFVLHGGTNFGYTAGANSGGKGGYEPDLTSYDYGSPINEQGHPTKEFTILRDIISSHLPDAAKVPEPATPPAAMIIDDFTPVRVAGLWDLLPPARNIKLDMMWFEAWGQNQGLALYQTELPAGPAADFSFEHLNDFGQIYLDGKRIATYDRREGKEKKIAIPARAKPVMLEIMVEGMGHINFSIAMESDRKGLFGKLKLGEKDLDRWKVAPLPLLPSDVSDVKPPATASTRPGSLFRATVTLKDKPADTFFDMSKYSKGMIWVNGHNLGRFWNIGPQLRLYCPASWLKQGENVVEIIDQELTEPRPIRGCVERNLDMKNATTRNANNEW